MKAKILVLLSILLGIALFTVVASSVDTGIVFQTLKLLSLPKFLLLLGFYLVLFVISLARWGMTINAFGSHVSFLRLLSFRLSEWACGYITPFSRLGGEPVMAYLLKKEGKIKFRKGISVIIINKVFDFASALVLVLIGFVLLIVNYWNNLTAKTIFLLILAIAALVSLVYMFYVKTFKKQGFFTMLIKPFKEIVHKSLHDNVKVVEEHLIDFFKKNRNLIIVLGLVSLMYQVLMLVEYKIITIILGIDISLISLLIINLFLVLAFIVPTPGSLGGMEGAMAFAFSLLGIGASKGFAFSLVLRSVEITLTIVGLVFSYYYGLKSFKKIAEEKF